MILWKEDIAYYVIFSLDLILMFFVEHHYQTDEGDIDGKESNVHVNGVEYRLSKIAMIRLQGPFMFEFVTLLPLEEIFSSWKYARLLTLIKCLRFLIGWDLLRAERYIKWVRTLQKKNLEQTLEQEIEIAQDKTRDITYTSKFIFF